MASLAVYPIPHVSHGLFMLANSQNDETVPDGVRAASDAVKPVRQLGSSDPSFRDVCRVENQSSDVRSKRGPDRV